MYYEMTELRQFDIVLICDTTSLSDEWKKREYRRRLGCIWEYSVHSRVKLAEGLASDYRPTGNWPFTKK